MCDVTMRVGARGRVKISVLQDGVVVREFPEQENLILDQGLNNIATQRWADQLAYCVAGTGSTPTKDVPTGTYSQSGTTVTRQTGSVDFAAGDVGKLLRFSTGEEAYITAFTSATQVTVSVSRTVATTTIILFRVAQVGLATEVERSNTYPSFTLPDTTLSQDTIINSGAGTFKMRRTYDFAVRGSNINYTEIGISPSSGAGNNLFSRLLLSGAVTVLTGQQLRVQYELVLYSPDINTHTQQTLAITGWPRPYTTSSITSTASDFTVTLTEAHHYLAGGKINISGVTPSAYNGEWTIASVTSTTVVVTSAINPGTATVQGTVVNDLKAAAYVVNPPIRQLVAGAITDYRGGHNTSAAAVNNNWLWDGSAAGLRAVLYAATSAPAYSTTSFNTVSGGTEKDLTLQSYVSGSFQEVATGTYAAGEGNRQDIRSIGFFRRNTVDGGTTTAIYQLVLEQRQRKDSTHSLTISFTRQWGRDLTVTPN